MRRGQRIDAGPLCVALPIRGAAPRFVSALRSGLAFTPEATAAAQQANTRDLSVLCDLRPCFLVPLAGSRRGGVWRVVPPARVRPRSAKPSPPRCPGAPGSVNETRRCQVVGLLERGVRPPCWLVCQGWGAI